MPSSAMIQERSAAVGGIACHALRSARLSEIDALRDRPGPAGTPALPSRFLRHADEQSVLGMHAVLDALAAMPEPCPVIERCGVVSATCQAGRIAAARTLVQFAEQGAVGVSPHVVPQCSLHSLAGAVSVALGMHGPHVGVGGGTDAVAEGLVAALSLLTLSLGESLPGVWLVATEWDEEPVLDPRGAATNDPLCRALAMLLVAGGEHDLEIDLRGPGAARPRPREAAERRGQLTEFARAVTMCRQGTALESWALECPWSGVIRVARRRARASRFGRREAA
jgi:hypothetical protein